MSIKELESIKNIGPSCALRIHRAGIENLDQMQHLGTEEVFLRVFEANGRGSIMCTCFLYAIEGAITNTKWHEIPNTRKAQLKKFMKDFRKNL